MLAHAGKQWCRRRCIPKLLASTVTSTRGRILTLPLQEIRREIAHGPMRYSGACSLLRLPATGRRRSSWGGAGSGFALLGMAG